MTRSGMERIGCKRLLGNWITKGTDMAITEGILGEWKYQHEHYGSRSRINWHNPPPAGTKLINPWDGGELTVDEIGPAGMIHATNAEGFHSASFPWDVKVPNASFSRGPSGPSAGSDS